VDLNVNRRGRECFQYVNRSDMSLCLRRCLVFRGWVSSLFTWGRTSVVWRRYILVLMVDSWSDLLIG